MRLIPLLLLAALILGLRKDAGIIQQQAESYLNHYNKKYQELSTKASEAEWALNTMIVEGDSTRAKAAEKAKQEFADFTGSKKNIDSSRLFLEQKNQLTDLQVRQLNTILFLAGNNPATVPELVQQRIAAETRQTEKLFGFDFKIDGRSVTTNEIDKILTESNNEAERLKAWQASKEVGKQLKEGLIDLQRLRNETVRGLGFSDFFQYQVSEYDMSTVEMMQLTKKLMQEVWPLYRQLHTYARYELAKKYNKPVPAWLPAHWLPNRWAQSWEDMVQVKGINLDSVLGLKTAEWIVQKGEEFYKSIGFEALPSSFWERSSLYPLPAGTPYKKNNHASAWHIDRDKDVRSLMSVEPNARWYETTNHELGHIYYYLSYSRPQMPVILRRGANRAMHEAFGSQIGFAALQPPFLAQHGLLPSGAGGSRLQKLLKEALNYIVFIPWSAGVMTEFEHDLYARNLKPDDYNQHWWQLVKKYQGVVPPSPRGEEYCDAATKTHINNDPAQYYDYALSFVLLFQFHQHIAKNILNQSVYETNYYGSKAVGDYLRSIMKWGATRDWRELLKETTGEEISAGAMLHYFQPVMAYLQKMNAGRKHTLPERMD